MADADRRQRPAVPRLFPDDRLRPVGARSGLADPRSDHGDAGEGPDLEARICRRRARRARYPVRGAAWTAGADIAKVEVSTDGGATWQHAHLLGKPVRNAWRLWEYDWQVPAKPGKAALIVRATDSEGRTQPVERDGDRGGYLRKPPPPDRSRCAVTQLSPTQSSPLNEQASPRREKESSAQNENAPRHLHRRRWRPFSSPCSF